VVLVVCVRDQELDITLTTAAHPAKIAINQGGREIYSIASLHINLLPFHIPTQFLPSPTNVKNNGRDQN